MLQLWSRGGLSWRELVVRTCREAWEDEIFGHSARLSFYIFLALPPCLLLLLITLAQLGAPGLELRQVLLNASSAVLPDDAAGVLNKAVQYFAGQRIFGLAGVVAVVTATWTALNGTWALRAALNAAYEVDEDRSAPRLMRRDILLVLTLGAFSVAGPMAVLFTRRLSTSVGPLFSRTVHFVVLVILTLIVFGMFYRFVPNLRKERIRWTTPGTFVGVVLLLAIGGIFRVYFQYIQSNRPTYGPLAGVALLLIWLYLASACLLIGAEMNSEIEKADTEPGHRDRRMRRQQRPAA